jgi:arylsulfatase A-like enzyme
MAFRAFRAAAVSLVLSIAVDAAQRPNVLLLVADDMRPDVVRALGHPVIETPRLDALVGEGLTFKRAVAAYPICHVSRAELLTGATAFRCGVPFRGTRIDSSLAHWAATFHSGGYHAWYVGKWDCDGTPRQRGYEETRGLFTGGGGGGGNAGIQKDERGHDVTGYRGWTFKTDDGKAEPKKGVGLTPDISRHFANAAIEFIQRKPEKPFFLHVNFSAPHDPRLIPPGFEDRYDPAKIPLPPNFMPAHPFDHGNALGRDEKLLPHPRTPGEVRAELAAYYAVVSHLDAQIGRILDALAATGQDTNTIVIFTSDQGLALGSHGLIGKQNMYDHTVGVPLIFRGSGVPRGRRTEAFCYLRDLFPTACGLAGVPVPPTVQGRSMVPLIRGETQVLHPFVVCYFTDTQRMIRDQGWKLVVYPKAGRMQLFDVVSDPWETTDLSNRPDQADRISTLRSQMVQWLQKEGDPLGLK